MDDGCLKINYRLIAKINIDINYRFAISDSALLLIESLDSDTGLSF